ncbi:MAG: redoxin family protein, partial [Gemmatimonadaceae bacterium]
ELTGDFDVVAQFSIAAANRVLAVMHSNERFPHSVSIRVDDIPPRDLRDLHPIAVAGIDRFGDTLAEHGRIRDLVPVTGLLASSDLLSFVLDPVVNTANPGLFEHPLVPTNIQGRAQLQIFPPTIDVPVGPGTNVTVRIRLLARYFPDPGTSLLAEFIRGTLKITVPVSQVASQVGNVVEIDIKGANVTVDFTNHSSSRPLSPQDLAALNRLIGNMLKTSFLPSNSTLPSNIRNMQFKTLLGAGKAIAVLLNLESDPGNSNSVNNIFLGPSDDFVFGVGSDFVKAAFQPTIDSILSTPVDPVKFDIEGVVHTWHITYTIVLKSASVDLRNGEIVLTIKGRATTPSWPPNFDFTVTQKFSLEVSGDTADLVVGDVSLDTSSWIIDRFRGRGTTAIKKARDRALSQSNARQTVRRMLSAGANLGGFLTSLAKPPSEVSAPAQGFELAYTDAEIRTSGIVLHGSLGTSHWPAVHVEFEQISSGGGAGGPLGALGIDPVPDQSALKSWIPGGTILKYEWKSLGQSQPGLIDENRFVRIKPPPGFTSSDATPVSGYRPLCLTIHGISISARGPVVERPVTATMCNIKSFPIIDAAYDGVLPLIALAEPSPRGTVHVTGHTSARKAESGNITPNLIVHFGDRSTAGNLEDLLQALRESGRTDASTAVVAVLSPVDMAEARYTEGVTFAEDPDGAWERRFGLRISRRPLTLIVPPNGKVAWEHEGEIDSRRLAEALRKFLVAGAPVSPTMQPNGVRIGRRPPNFLFGYAPGREVTLRKIAGQPVKLVFWRSSSKQSIDMARDVKRSDEEGAAQLVLAINDGDPTDRASAVAAEHKFSAILVTDPAREISLAYGVNTWPTTVSIDALGRVTAISNGAGDGAADLSGVEQTAAGSAS